MNFIQQLFGKQGGGAPSKKGWLSIAVHRPSGRILSYCRGQLNHMAHWGQVEFLLEQRIEECQKHYDFIPDEVIIGFIVENIEKVPTLDKAKPEPFEQYIKGRKPEKEVSLREYQYRKESKLKESDPLPPQYQTWVALQNSRELSNRHATDLKDFKLELAKQPIDADRLTSLMSSYLSDTVLFGKFIEVMTQMDGLERRIALYTQLESLIEESKLYKQSRVEEMDYFLMMPASQMEPIHVLACETLRDALRKENDGRIFGIPKSKLKGQGNYDRLCKMMIDYHTYMKMPLDTVDEEYNMKHRSSSDMEGLVNAIRDEGMYDETDSDAYPGMGQHQGQPVGQPKVAVNMGDLNEEQPGSTVSEQRSPSQVLMEMMEPKIKEPVTPPVTREAPIQPEVHLPEAPVPPAQPVQQPAVPQVPTIDEELEATKSIQRLSAGALLRDEIFRWREHVSITKRQLEWAFAQPYITAEKLIQNGTLHGAVLKTAYFTQLVSTVANSDDDITALSSADRNILLAYGLSMDRTYAEYEAMLSQVEEDSSDYAAINRQKASLVAEYGRVKSKIELLRKDEQRRLRSQAIGQAGQWLDHFFEGTPYPLLTEKAFFQQFVDYEGDPTYLGEVLSKIEQLSAQPMERQGRTLGDLLQGLQRFEGQSSAVKGGSLFIPFEELKELSAEQCSWSQVLYLLVYYLLERDRLNKETHTDVNGVCEMIQLHVRLGRKIPGWMLQSLYWVIDVENKVNRYCEALREVYRYALDAYQSTDKGAIEPYAWKAVADRLEFQSLAATLAQWGNRFTRWYDAEEVWNWYNQGDATPNGFVPADDEAYKKKAKPKKITEAVKQAIASTESLPSSQTEGQSESPAVNETASQEQPVVAQEGGQKEGKESQEQQEKSKSEEHTEQPSVEQTGGTVSIETAAQKALPEHIEKQKEEKQGSDEPSESGTDMGDMNLVDPTEGLEGFGDEPVQDSADLEQEAQVAKSSETAIELPELNVPGEVDAALTKDMALPLFEEVAEEQIALNDSEVQAVFGQDDEAVLVDNYQFNAWKWNDSSLVVQLGADVSEHLDKRMKGISEDVEIGYDLFMGLLIVNRDHIADCMWEIYSLYEEKVDTLFAVADVWKALAQDFKAFNAGRTLELFVQRLNERSEYLKVCLKKGTNQ